MADALQPCPSSDATSLEGRGFLNNTSKKAEYYLGRIPYLRKLPFASIAVIASVAIGNVLLWVAVGVVLHFHPALTATAVLSYTLGLRHALDADHISAIDLMTRRLIASGQRPVTVGTFFSLGHSTIVIITSIVVAATASAVSSKFDSFSRVGGIIGTSVSAAFLILLGILNSYVLYKLVKQLRQAIAMQPGEEQNFKITGAGCLFNVLKAMFKLIDRPWKMYPLGVLFGLGFDTSSEIALLGISSIQASSGTSIWIILLFPLLFTAGMCLLDTTDGALMMALYTSTSLARDTLAVLYYSIVLTVITVLVALVVGVLQLLSLSLNVAEPTGRFWDGVERAGDSYEIIGGAICGTFVVGGIASVLFYRPWRLRVDRWRAANAARLGEAPADHQNPYDDGLRHPPYSDLEGQHQQQQQQGTRVLVERDGDDDGANVAGSKGGRVEAHGQSAAKGDAKRLSIHEVYGERS
ncbi:high-affinity nickel transport protein-like protein [Phyllosticta citriasiana]|uniref:Nickel/cobalt efflux system n=1 Tax=Phyllosticta citriasiana TaxID=595635 RepID=A0ABR1KIC2_9PEZI